MEKLLNKYISEISKKILLKGISNKTEQQILLQSFKYYDYNSTGFCNYESFIKVNQKIGVLFNNPQDIQKIFAYFDINNEGIINYNDFINKIFKPNVNKTSYKNNTNITYSPNKSQNCSNKHKTNNYSKTNYYSSYENDKKDCILKINKNNQNFDYIPPYKKPFFDKIVNSLLNNEIGAGVALLVLHHGFILGDNNFTNQITIEEFIKIINDNNIDLSISDIQMLFHSYELNKDGFFY